MLQCPGCGGYSVMTDFDTLEYLAGFCYCRDCYEEWVEEDELEEWQWEAYGDE